MLNLEQELKLREASRRELLRKARLHQLMRQAERDREQVGDRLMALLGDLMISGGKKLKERSGVPSIAEV